MGRLNLRALIHKLLSNESVPTPEEDLECLQGAEHFGYAAQWVYGEFGDNWPVHEPRPVFGWLGVIPVVEA